jgi:small GTP-binding protein
VYIYSKGELLYHRHFGKALKDDVFNSLAADLMKDAFAKRGKKVEYHDYYKYRISYITEKDSELMFLFVTGLTDNFENIKKELIKCKKEFLNLFEDLLEHKIDEKTFEIFDPTIDAIHRNLRPKISLIGFSGVGKTTITRLIKAEEIPMQHIPTITGDIATIKIGKLHFHLWDFAGQEQFSYLWNNFIKGSDAVLLITDSSLENVEKSKFFLELIKEQAPQAHTSVIGNKQDLDDAMKPEQIEKIIGLKTYSMIANDSNNRDKMITIIADVLEMSAEVSPLLKPLLERDTYMEQAVKALESAEFSKAATFFDKISDLCIELGDDSLGKEFYEKSQKIKSMLQKLSAPQPVPPEEPKVIESSAPSEEPTKPVEESKVKKPTIPESPKPEEQEKPKVPIAAPPPPPPHVPPKEPKVPIAAPPPPPPPPHVLPKASKVPDKEMGLKKPSVPPSPGALKKPKLIEKTVVPLHPEKSAPPKIPKTEEPETEKAGFKKIEEEKETSEPEALIKPKILQEKVELALNPEDFMVKPRPKTVTVVPKDAKNKLKTSPFAQVTNPTEVETPVPVTPTKLIKTKPPALFTPTKKIDTPIIPKKSEVPPSKVFEVPKEITQPPTPVSPTELIKPKAKVVAVTPSKILSTEPPTTTQKTAEPTVQATSTGISMEQRANIEKSLMDLKIKKANISKMSLDFDMKELTGEITSEELEEKKGKMDAIKADLNQQIKELEQLLK